MPDDNVTRGDLEVLRSELKDDIAHTRLEVAQLRTDISERFGAVRADLADVRKELAVLQVDIRKDLATFGQQHDQMRQELRDMRQSMDRWQATTARQLWTMVSVVSGAVIVGILKLVSFP